jgi:hypothetical protein
MTEILEAPRVMVEQFARNRSLNKLARIAWAVLAKGANYRWSF